MLDLECLLIGCADTGFEDGIRIDADLQPLSGTGAPVKPAVDEGGKYQLDRRWAASDDAASVQVIVIDSDPSQANRLEHAWWSDRRLSGIPEFILDLCELGDLPAHLPAHLPRSISSLQFPHRNADADLRDATLAERPFVKSDLGQFNLAATAQDCGPLMSWFPEAHQTSQKQELSS